MYPRASRAGAVAVGYTVPLTGNVSQPGQCGPTGMVGLCGDKPQQLCTDPLGFSQNFVTATAGTIVLTPQVEFDVHGIVITTTLAVAVLFTIQQISKAGENFLDGQGSGGINATFYSTLAFQVPMALYIGKISSSVPLRITAIQSSGADAVLHGALYGISYR